MKIILSSLLFAYSFCLSAQGFTVFPLGNLGNNQHHTGKVWLNELNHADSTFNFSIALATFEKGALLDWHQHPGGQILQIVDGVGYYQERGKAVELVRKGDIVKCRPDVEHWHGASHESGVAYLAISPAHKGRTIWHQPVTKEEYQMALALKVQPANQEEEIRKLSLDKWRWMAEKKVDTLATLFNNKAMFIHMGGNMNKEQELNVIQTGRIQYRKTEIEETSVQILGETAILLSKLRLTAVVNGNEVVNPFTVTEVYIREGNRWTMGALSFTRLLTPQGQ